MFLYRKCRNRQGKGDQKSVEDLNFRIDLLQRFDIPTSNVSELTCGNTHGDYVISQFVCGEGKINAVIDWTSACNHPLIWEIMRSFVYAEPSCAQGDVDIEKLIQYLQNYLKFSPLTSKDILMLPDIFYYQIAVCDYYHQYYSSTAENRNLFLYQAQFSTQLMHWFDKNLEDLKYQLMKI